MVDVLADIITEHEFTFTSPRLLDYDHCATVPPVTKKLNLPFPLNKGDWTVTHAKQGPTVSFSLGWKGIRPGVLKDVEVTQAQKAHSTSQVNYLANEGKVDLALDHSGTTAQMHSSYESTATYVYNVFFAQLHEMPQEMDQDYAAKSVKIYLNTIDRQHSNDVRFVFPSTGGDELEIWANTRTLVDASPYFKALFTSEFAEAQLKNKWEHEAGRDDNGKRADGLEDDLDDSDDEMDLEIIGNRNFDPSTNPPCSCTYREVVVRSTAYTTYKAVLGYLHSSFISFAPLSSSTSSDYDTSGDLIHTDDNTDSTRLPSASPKSVYRLAHLLELPKLAQLALDNIESQLTPANVALELFGNLAGVYDDLRKIELDYFIANYDAVKATKTMDIVKQKAVAAELTYYPLTSMEVMERFSSIQ